VIHCCSASATCESTLGSTSQFSVTYIALVAGSIPLADRSTLATCRSSIVLPARRVSTQITNSMGTCMTVVTARFLSLLLKCYRRPFAPPTLNQSLWTRNAEIDSRFAPHTTMAPEWIGPKTG
jgi:hypothetical protein